MNIIKQNPFRILGVIGDASEREIQKQIGIIKRFAEIGKFKTFDYDFKFIGDFTRNKDDIYRAASEIEQAPKKLLYSLFWFVKNSPFDEIAFNNLKDKHINKATEIWRKTIKQEISNKNYSSYLNLSTLYIASATVDKQLKMKPLQEGIALKGSLIHSDNINNLSKLVTGNGFVMDATEISKTFVDEVIELLNPYLNKKNGITAKELIVSLDLKMELSSRIESAYSSFLFLPLKKILINFLHILLLFLKEFSSGTIMYFN